MTGRERVEAAARGDRVDRPPFSVWRHFYPDENEGAARLAETTVRFARDHQLDLVKYNPRAQYHAEPWGTRYAYRGSAPPVPARYAVTRSEEWRTVTPRSLDEPAFGELLDGLRRVREALPGAALVATIFTPLGVLERLAGAQMLRRDLEARTLDVLAALDAVSETFSALASACVALADGIFLATTQWARRDVLDDGTYARFGTPFDLRVLAGAAGAPLNVLHVCGANARVVQLASYPVAAVSWNPQLPLNPSLAAFHAAVPDRAAVGGLSDDALTDRDPARARTEIADGRAQTGGARWIAAGGCTIPVGSPARTIDAARDALG